MTTTELDIVRLSKTISHALRHHPEQYGLQPDPEGWVFVEDMLRSLRARRPEWRQLSLNEIDAVIMQGDKQRFERNNDMIRALYGHSIEQHPQFVLRKPPSPLYHGTQEGTAVKIIEVGLKPMQRQFVHMASDQQTAIRVATRRHGTPVLLIIDALTAYEDGIEFYHGGETTWLAKHIPPEYISTIYEK